ncbi:hypothetical protein QEN19_002283 [Hanseniaspora menglaensis]
MKCAKVSSSVETLTAICKNNIISLLERKRFALKLLIKVFRSLLPYRLLLIELLLDFYSIKNLRISKQTRDEKQYEVILWLEEMDPELILHTNQIWFNFSQTLENFSIHNDWSNNADDELLNLLLHNKNMSTVNSLLKQKLATKFKKTKSYKAFYLHTLKNLKLKKSAATANIIKIQKNLQLERESRSIVILDNLELEAKQTQQKKIARSKLFKKALNEHKTDSKKFLSADASTKTNKRKSEHNAVKPKIKRVKL